MADTVRLTIETMMRRPACSAGSIAAPPKIGSRLRRGHPCRHE